MKRFPIVAALSMVLLLQPWQASAQTWSQQQQEVWAAVQAQWHAAMAMDTRLTGCVVFPEDRGRMDGEVPRHDESGGWDRYDVESVSTMVHNLVPMEILFHGDTALVNYHYYSPTPTDPEGKHRILLGRYTDTLVKENNRWRFRALPGGTADAAL